jgi:hypothetical protein
MKVDFVAVVESKRFLGREFLTWLLHRVEEAGGAAMDGWDIRLGDRVVLAGEPDGRARLTVVGEGDVRSEIGAGLRRGKLIDRARLVLAHGERRWELTLDGGVLSYDGVRCPPLGERDPGGHADPRAAFENDLFLRLAELEEPLAVVDALFADFCRLRGSAAWARETLPALRAWVAGLG